jgi:hypothetical protein
MSCVGILRAHSRLVLGAFQLSDGSLISWGDDDTLAVWSIPAANELRRIRFAKDMAPGDRICELGDGRLMYDRLVRTETGLQNAVFVMSVRDGQGAAAFQRDARLDNPEMYRLYMERFHSSLVADGSILDDVGDEPTVILSTRYEGQRWWAVKWHCSAKPSVQRLLLPDGTVVLAWSGNDLEFLKVQSVN